MKTVNKSGAEKLYSLFRIDDNGDRATYVGPEHTDLSRDQAVVTQKAPVASKDYPGARKSSLKLIRTGISTEAGKPVKRDMRVEISTSHTAGFTIEEVDALILEAVNFYKDEIQRKAIVYTGQRPA